MNSLSNPDSCICLFASPGPPIAAKPNQDQIIVEISIQLAATHKNPIKKTFPKILQTTKKTFHYSRPAFLSAPPDEQCRLLGDIFQGLETPFALENIHWGLNFPTGDQTLPGSHPDEVISDRLLGIARFCAENDRIERMNMRVMKLERLELGKFRQLRDQHVRGRYLDNWILENKGNVKLERCLEFIYELRRSSTDDKLYGLKSEKVESSESCSICIKNLEKNLEAIRMPCSHVFHGFCIFKWLQMNPNCPLCRFQLFSPRN